MFVLLIKWVYQKLFLFAFNYADKLEMHLVIPSGPEQLSDVLDKPVVQSTDDDSRHDGTFRCTSIRTSSSPLVAKGVWLLQKPF